MFDIEKLQLKGLGLTKRQFKGNNQFIKFGIDGTSIQTTYKFYSLELEQSGKRKF